MKTIILHMLKIVGFFKIAKRFSKRNLLILAYHGVEIEYESEFSPKLFIKRTTLKERMACLKEHGFHVVPLNEATDISNWDRLPDNSIVITVDDGWFSTLSEAHDVFSHYSFPYTLYVTSYYVDKESPVLNVVLRYMIWKTNINSVGFDQLEEEGLKGTYSLASLHEKKRTEIGLVKYLNALPTHEEKVNFISKLANVLSVDYRAIEKSRRLSLLSPDEIIDMAEQGVNIQLHTHRHTMHHNDVDGFKDEIIQNRLVLERAVKSNMTHFCYPSGDYAPGSEVWLRELGVYSATTCHAGFVSKQTNPYYLPRFLDGENIPHIVFEAEIYGVLEFFRKVKRIMKPLNHVLL
ncbi:polysaccharide deacetylase family protein [Desulfoluna spongiiphila]|uniref:polysaccharide deacetylase family protein n=1 Tax=Desulfoluna spongiiphila TaxID=419481 RepID=UPI00125C65E8|nr:polysaccharide deacetylase family protein [Desulfoluna spongiiphila]VVS94010.1 glycoside hydrolase/deacetylase beta/alpha-barrel [Desulfoluna spongiiphila]